MRRILPLLTLFGTPDRALYVDLVHREAALQGVPPALADAVAMVETGYRVDAVGTSGEIGMMQIMPATARQLGFAGTAADLFLPANNVRLGVQYLSRAWAISGGSVCRALMKYRAGLAQEVMTPLSVQYCARALSWMAATGSDLGHGTPLAGGPVAAAPPDPYVVSIGPASAGKLPTVLAPQPAAFYRTYRSMAQRNAALNARYQSHMRQPAASAAVSEAVNAALSED